MHLIYTTFQTHEEAVRIANILVKRRLIACANIHDGVTSIYEWEGKLEQTKEFTMICKVPDSAVDSVINEIKQYHSYTTPCILAIKIEKGNEDYLKWVESCNKLDY